MLGVFLIIFVPDEYLYEQNMWPGFFSPEHYSSFRLNNGNGVTPVSYDIGQLCRELTHANVVYVVTQLTNWLAMHLRRLKWLFRKLPNLLKKATD